MFRGHNATNTPRPLFDFTWHFVLSHWRRAPKTHRPSFLQEAGLDPFIQDIYRTIQCLCTRSKGTLRAFASCTKGHSLQTQQHRAVANAPKPSVVLLWSSEEALIQSPNLQQYILSAQCPYHPMAALLNGASRQRPPHVQGTDSILNAFLMKLGYAQLGGGGQGSTVQLL